MRQRCKFVHAREWILPVDLEIDRIVADVLPLNVAIPNAICTENDAIPLYAIVNDSVAVHISIIACERYWKFYRVRCDRRLPPDPSSLARMTRTIEQRCAGLRQFHLDLVSTCGLYLRDAQSRVVRFEAVRWDAARLNYILA